MDPEVGDYLRHFGIKGMKWGRRRPRGPDGRVKNTPSATFDLTRDETGESRTISYNPNKLKPNSDFSKFEGSRREAKKVQKQIDTAGRELNVSDDAQAARAAKQKIKSTGVSSLSNKELQEFVTRTNLEQQYSKLTSNEKTAMDSGKKFAAQVIGDSAKEVSKDLVKQQLKKGAVELGKKATAFAAKQAVSK